MEALAAQSRDVVLALLVPALLFGIVALGVNRRMVFAGLREARRETLTNLALVAINTVLLAGLFALATETVHDQLRLFPALADFWLGVPAAGLQLLALLIDEFVVYWRHRMEHTRAFWPIHATHHSDEAMTWLTLLRKHPLSHFLGHLVDAIPLILLGFPAWAVVASMAIRTWWGYFIHTGMPWTLGSLGKVLISPAAHRLHHIDDERLMSQNFGGFFTLWDRLFGTFDDAGRYLGCRTGIAGGSRPVLGELARPVEALLRQDKGAPAAPPA
jgi:sterol desaturase/sphingolipid hydroxylase (fatty acid hydroxylase superfamily)